MATYAADPGGVFESDAHRRVLAHLPLPDDDPLAAQDVLARLLPDVGSDFSDLGEVTSVLTDLEDSGFASLLKAGWKMTKKGLDALTAEVPDGEL